MKRGRASVCGAWAAATFLAAISSGCGASSSAGPGKTGETYVPEAPVAYDGKYLDGSFEDGNGFGWDTCYTRTFGEVTKPASGGSEGDGYVSLGTAASCRDPSLATCGQADAPSTSQLYLWFKTPVPASEMGLYFDAKIAAGADVAGSLRLYGTNLECTEEALLADVPLGDLHLTSTWSVRCVNVTHLDAHGAIGLAVIDGTQAIYVDAIRIGHACHAAQ